MQDLWIIKLLLLYFLFFCSSQSLSAQISESCGANMPYTRYESENAVLGSGAKLKRAPHFSQHKIASEASNQGYVELSQQGAYLSWKVKAAARGFNLRFTLPDDSTGNGLKGSLCLYVNGKKIKTINLSSYWAYQYFKTADPDSYQTPKEKTYMRFDEIHFKLSSRLNRGDTLTIKKERKDTLSYGVDFIELEPVPSSLKQPSGYISVAHCGAVADDDQDDLSAFKMCLKQANQLKKNLYIPPGRFVLSDKLPLNVKNMKIMGAGIWHTTLFFSTNKQSFGGIKARAGNVEISNFSMNTANNARYKYDENNARNPESKYKDYKGFYGTYGDHSYIHDIWIEHFEVGFWIAGYSPPYPVDITQNLTVANSRIRNNYADGVNFSEGTSNSTVENCSFRNNGDDAMAVWPNNSSVDQPAINDTFQNNTVENNWRAGSAAIFGGYGHQIHHCLIKDSMAGSGIRFTNDFPGFSYDSTHAPIRIYKNTLIHSGTSKDIWNKKRGAIELHGNSGIFNIQFNDNVILNSQHNAIQMHGKNFHNITFSNAVINGTGIDLSVKSKADSSGAFGIYAAVKSKKVVFKRLSIKNAKSGKYFNLYPTFQLIILEKDIPLD